MLPTVLLMLPGNTDFNDGGIVRIRSNVSKSSSEIISLVTGILIVVLLVPAGKVAVIGVEV